MDGGSTLRPILIIAAGIVVAGLAVGLLARLIG